MPHCCGLKLSWFLDPMEQNQPQGPLFHTPGPSGFTIYFCVIIEGPGK